MNWWDRWPQRLQQEMDRFTAKGWRPNDVSTPPSLKCGVRMVEVQCPMGDAVHTLRVEYPPEFPFFGPKVYTVDRAVLFPRHHNPMNGEVCLLERGGVAWDASESAADMMDTQLRILMDILTAPEAQASREAEAAQGEQVQGYILSEQCIMVHDHLNIPADTGRGTFVAARLPGGSASAHRYVITEIRDERGTVLSQAPKALIAAGGEKITGSWARGEVPLGLLPNTEQLAAHVCNTADHRRCQQVLGTPKAEGLFAVIYSDEVGQGRYADALLACHLSNPNTSKSTKGRKRCKYVRLKAAPYGAAERFARSPALQSLPTKRVCVVGTGMLGSPITLQLARAGVGELMLVDGDEIDIATTIRYGLGVQYAGWNKVDALEDYVRRNYPLTRVRPIISTVGFPGARYHDVLKAISEADLVIDAAAEGLVSRYLNDVCRTYRTPLLTVATRPGSYGGEVWFSSGEDGPCWECFVLHQRDQQMAYPNGDDESDPIQHGGCSMPTTVGYGFDSDLFSLAAVRYAVGFLTHGQGGYPLPDFNAQVINLRDAHGALIGPEYHAYQFQTHPDCQCCHRFQL